MKKQSTQIPIPVLIDDVDGICVELREVPGHNVLQYHHVHRQCQPVTMSVS